MLARWHLARHIRRTQKAVAQLTQAMAMAGITRQERRRIWREVVAGRLDVRELIGG